jgi:MHS family proline/betaine transporter-like MFS transporter
MAFAPLKSSQHPASPSGISPGRLIAAGLIGNVLEWYDFSLYGYFAPMIGHYFFPSRNSATSLIAAFAVFSLGFVTRPLGAVLFGYIGDRYSRERALTLSILAMALPTCTTGLLPGYGTIGMIAPLTMLGLRLTQGLSAGGEYTTSIVFLVERSGGGRRGLMGSFGLFGSLAGGMLGSGLGALLAYLMAPATLFAWGWRIPFILGFAPAFFGIMLRRQLAAHASVSPPTPSTIGHILLAQWRCVLLVFGFELLEAVGFYTVFIYLTTYLTKVVGLQERQVFTINTLCLGSALLVIPLSGWLSDRMGRRPLLLLAASAAALFSWPLFLLMRRGSFVWALLGQLGLAIIVALYEGSAPAAATEAFPAAVRASAVAVAFNLCMTLFGGTTPMVATVLIAHSTVMAPALYLIVAALVSAVAVLRLPETAAAPLAS